MKPYKHLTKVTKQLLAAVMLTVAGISCAGAQTVALKSNILYDATATINLGIEFGLAPKWSLDVSGNFNAWDINGHKWKHWLAQPEARYWFCQRFSGHFLGAHLIGGQFNIGNVDLPFSFLGTDFRELKDHRWQGWMGGAGLAYGYTWIIDKHWSAEAEIGIGWIYSRYDTYNCASCGRKLRENTPHNYVGPTKAAINIVYYF